MSATRSYLLFLLTVWVSCAVDLTHKDCGSSAEIVKVWSDDCADPVCKAKKGHFHPG
jgi:hypothetical protein